MNRQPCCHTACSALIVLMLLISACSEQDDKRITDPLQAISGYSNSMADRQLDPFPEMLEFVPAVRISTPADPLPSQLSDAELVDEVTRANGRVIIGIKPGAAPRSRETGVIPAIDRATALAGRAELVALGAQITMTYRHSSAVVATIPVES